MFKCVLGSLNSTRNKEDNSQFDILYGIPQINILYIITKYIQNKSSFSSLINFKCSTGGPVIDINLFGNPKLVFHDGVPIVLRSKL